MTALVGVKRSLARLPAGVPDSVTVLYVEVTAARIHRHSVVTVAGYTAELGVLAEIISARRVGDESKEVLRAQVVDPGPGGAGIGYHILPVLIVIVSVFLCHILISLRGTCKRAVP